VLEHTLSEEERNQILQTIDMFEVITQTQPDDYQSLDILKEAYTKVGRQDEALRASRKLAEAYFNAGSYALAMQECEVLLLRDPNAPEVLAMLGEIEARLQAAGQTMKIGGATHGLVAQAYGQGQGGGLVSSVAKRRAITCTSAGRPPRQIPHRPTNRFRRSGKCRARDRAGS